ncbi:diacylglycerol kinase family lipid kinase [Desulfosporosinus fructosivorans]|uniref:Diacylglycerol kinase family lipid kinase n=1 Tax=Desulfosporosinus fructosivorans TaxID=2018669 RepID=A0A4Z0R8Z9_9FIRM|nr:diacylglycerol kinase family protein [Desulfosporosinus fructosivorans]TGE38924.1 diacylglycerol kinase family lipid kinase [Desulfosporosinus fructosivorans]
MKSKRIRLVYNPYAGRRKLTAQLDTVIRIFQESGHEVSIHRASSPEDVEEIAAQSADVDRLVIAGGDGSIHQAVNGLLRIPTEKRPVLGILPVGTANDLAYALHLPKSIPEACKVIGKGSVFEMDTGKSNERYFINVASAGLLTDVSQKVDTRVKNTLGQLAYFLKGIETLPSFRPFHIEFEHGGKSYTEEVVLFMAVNGLSVGGLRNLVPRASLTDGKLDILIVPAAGWPETLRLLLSVLTGEKANSEKIIEFHTSKLKIHTDRPIKSDLDGEAGPESTWNIEIGPKISVLC